ncbi:hypothetical protein R69927_07490 [Paraburkholderia domus]|nr:hypothetical protein [Burkholderia sp. R-69927]CAE6937282.1 hypothetical protein R69927_07490 [Paraburkholderia domus]
MAYAIGMSEVGLLGKTGTTKADIDRLCKRLPSKARHVHAAYEADPRDDGLCRKLVHKGFDCMVCAPSPIPKNPGGRIKTDWRDALKLARALRAGDLSPVPISDVEDEPFRDLVRTWQRIPRRFIDCGWDAQVRRCRRYRKLAARGKNVSIAVVAAARGEYQSTGHTVRCSARSTDDLVLLFASDRQLHGGVS